MSSVNSVISVKNSNIYPAITKSPRPAKTRQGAACGASLRRDSNIREANAQTFRVESALVPVITTPLNFHFDAAHTIVAVPTTRDGP